MRNWTMALALACAGWSGSALAQSGDARSIAPRVDRLEREMRAVQRKVFPGGTPIEPQITAPPAGPVEAPGSPASSAVADLTGRVASLEQQLSGMTGQIEQNGYRLRQLEEAFNAYKAATDARLRTLEGAGVDAAPADGTGASTGGVGGPAPRPAPRPATSTTAIDRATPARTASRAPAPRAETATRNDPARVEAVAAVEKPVTGDAAEDTYTYGYRLWDAKFYPEAQAQLKTVGQKWPKHRRASFAQNLLGRAYLDEGKPALASVALYDSYKKWPDGERAPDSLYYLGQSLTRLKKPADACKVYDELTDVYASRMSASLRGQVTKGRADAKCGA